MGVRVNGPSGRGRNWGLAFLAYGALLGCYLLRENKKHSLKIQPLLTAADNHAYTEQSNQKTLSKT